MRARTRTVTRKSGSLDAESGEGPGRREEEQQVFGGAAAILNQSEHLKCSRSEERCQPFEQKNRCPGDGDAHTETYGHHCNRGLCVVTDNGDFRCLVPVIEGITQGRQRHQENDDCREDTEETPLHLVIVSLNPFPDQGLGLGLGCKEGGAHVKVLSAQLGESASRLRN